MTDILPLIRICMQTMDSLISPTNSRAKFRDRMTQFSSISSIKASASRRRMSAMSQS